MVDASQRVAVVFGTRPEIIKLAPVIAALGDQAELVYTGQHYSDNMSLVFFDEIGIRDPDVELGVGGRTRSGQVGQLVAELGARFEAAPPRAVVVQGDTNSVLGAAIAANTCDVPIVHVEAGLRSFDRRMPEEHNRVLTDHVADVLAAPTDVAAGHLADEGITEGVEVTGNTIVDVAQQLLPDDATCDAVVARLLGADEPFLLGTLHRPENVDDRTTFLGILEQLGSLDHRVLLPLHPRSRQRLAGWGVDDLPANITVIEPVGYVDFLALQSRAHCIVSDSGGVQEEASILQRPVAVVRRSTERPEIMGVFGELVTDHTTLAAVIADLTSPARLELIAATPTPYGAGDAGERTVAAMRDRGLAD